jgi:hypothetical protein
LFCAKSRLLHLTVSSNLNAKETTMQGFVAIVLSLLCLSPPAWAQESGEATTIPVAAQIIDSHGSKWTLRLSDRAVLKNGVESGVSNILEVWYLNHEVWAWSGTEWKRWLVRWQSAGQEGSWPEKPPLPTTPGLRTAVPIGPQPGVTCSGVNLKPGDSIQKAVDAHPEDSVFCLAAGTYAKQSVSPKKGNQFIGAQGAVIDGQGLTSPAFWTTSASHVVIRNLVIKNYAAPTQYAMLQLWAPYALIQQNELTGATQGAGVWASSHALVIGNYIHDNAEEGYKVVYDDRNSQRAVGVTFDSNDIYNNNPTHGFWDSGEQGGGKAWNTQHLTFWYNYSHDNGGPGFWTDYDNIWTIYWYNKSYYNTHGIEHEISYNASIIGNDLVQNGGRDWMKDCPGWYFTCGAVTIENSGGSSGAYAGNIEIAYNRIIAGKYGRAIPLREQKRGHGQYGEWLVRGVYAHHNTIDVTEGLHEAQVGTTNDNGDQEMFAARAGIKFDYNDYVGIGTQHYFSWLNNGWLTWAQWQKQGFDLHSTNR